MRPSQLKFSLGSVLFLTLALFAFSANAQAPEPTTYLWTLIGNDGSRLAEERDAGIQAKMFALDWRIYSPAEGEIDPAYVQEKQAELQDLQQTGFRVILSMGMHDTPVWLHGRYTDSHYRNQYHESYGTKNGVDQGDANFVFNQELRDLAAQYIEAIFTTFGTNFAAVRLGGGRYGELTYPPAEYNGNTNCYWAFDARAQAQSPVPGWKPGDLSPNGEAEQFLDWYLGALVEYQNWQIEVVRRHYAGPLMMLYPSWGIRPGQIEQALADNLDGSSSAERNGEIQRGFDFERQIGALNDPGVVVTTTWLDADANRDNQEDPRFWSPVKYLATLARVRNLALFGENTGSGSLRDMVLSARQMERYGLLGMAWFREDQLFSGDYATLDDFRAVISAYNG